MRVILEFEKTQTLIEAVMKTTCLTIAVLILIQKDSAEFGNEYHKTKTILIRVDLSIEWLLIDGHEIQLNQ